MSTYRLVSPWTLANWADTSIFLYNPSLPGKPGLVNITTAELSVLARCDGMCELEDGEVLRRYIAEGVIAKSDAPASLSDMYVEYPFVHRTAVQWAITGACNYRCRHCFAASDAGGMSGGFSLDKCKDVIRQLAEVGVKRVELTGGEPLVHPHFLEIVEELTARGIKLHYIHTNGALLTQEVFDKLNALGQKPSIGMSFDGLGTHDWMRNKEGAEADAMRALELTHKNGFYLRVNININEVTAPRLLETCREMVNRYRAAIYLMRTCESPCWMDSASTPHTLSFADCLEVQMAVVEAALKEKWGVKIRSFSSFTIPADRDLRGEFAYWDSHPKTVRKLMNTCHAGSHFYIAHDGRVLPCNVFEGMTAVTGELTKDVNLHTRSLKDILTESEYTHMFDLTTEDLAKADPECGACKWFGVCAGGCRAFAFVMRILQAGKYDKEFVTYTGRSGITCAFFKGGYADRLRALWERYAADEFKHDRQ